jgi:hypothetical protein
MEMYGSHVAVLTLILILSFTSPAGAQQPAVDRAEAGRILLEQGIDGLKVLLERVQAPPLTFDQETQIRNLDTVLRREAARLQAEDGANAENINRTLADQLFLAATRFLNTVQRSAMGAAADVNANSDLPTDENELREYLRDLTSTASQDGGDDNDFGGDNDGIVIDGFSGGRMPNRDEIMEIRINDNAFTAELSQQGRGRTEIRTRGGTGRFNGDSTFNFQDESLDARNAFAATRPPYQTRDFTANLSGPLIRNRLTGTLGLQNNISDEGDTLRAITPAGVNNNSITRPGWERSATVRATTQLNEEHALNFSYTYGVSRGDNQNVGGFNLPEQGNKQKGTEYNFQIQETAILTPRISHELRFRVAGESEDTLPLTVGPHIVVPDAFRGGGSTELENGSEREILLANVLAYTGSTAAYKAGFEGTHQIERSDTRENFNGTFTFGSLEDYLARRPLQYSVNQGDPKLDTNMRTGAAFFQSDFRITPRMTMGFGVRYEAQTQLRDWNNIDPRFGFAYHFGGSTVFRGGTGIYHDRLQIWQLQEVQRFEGQRQVSIIIRNPSYPDPFQSGTLTVRIPSSVNMRDPNLANPYSWNSEATIESTVFGLDLTGSYRFVRGIHLYRGRNLNAPLDITSAIPRSCGPTLPESLCVRPFSDRGNIVQLESTGLSSAHEFRIGFQKRMSSINVRGNYSAQVANANVSGDPLDLPADNYDMTYEWGRTEPRHGINTSVNVRLPWNVAADTQFNWNSGDPYDLVTGRDDNRDTNTTDRPAGVYRNSLTGPSFFEMNMNFSKTFTLVAEATDNGPVAGGGYFGRRSGIRMTIEAEAQNLLNKVNYDRISGVITSPFFGKPIRARDGRQVAISVRFNF